MVGEPYAVGALRVAPRAVCALVSPNSTWELNAKFSRQSSTKHPESHENELAENADLKVLGTFGPGLCEARCLQREGDSHRRDVRGRACLFYCGASEGSV
jgi:hypothetical protein